MADAEAICEAVSRPNMRFVAIKTVEQQAILSVHRARQGFELHKAESSALKNPFTQNLGHTHTKTSNYFCSLTSGRSF